MSVRPVAVSVVIPTYHRPDSLRQAVVSVLAQQTHAPFEVIVVLSDPGNAADVSAARALAAGDSRVRIVEAPRGGAPAARNAGIRQARGAACALLDDDCAAGPGWLDAGLAALQHADLVQGRTWPAAKVNGWDRTLWIDGLTWLWESCNLFFSREAVERAGLFDEGWKSAQGGRPYGEDTEWGWRMVRKGARYAYAEAALVHHAIEPRSYWGWLRERAQIRFLPLVLRGAPELRAHRFPGRYFLNNRHIMVVAATVLGGTGALGRRAGAGRGGHVIMFAAGLTYLSYARNASSLGEIVTATRELPRRLLSESFELACLAYGSLRWRRLLL